jgi:hypothetical protein
MHKELWRGRHMYQVYTFHYLYFCFTTLEWSVFLLIATDILIVGMSCVSREDWLTLVPLWVSNYVWSFHFSCLTPLLSIFISFVWHCRFRPEDSGLDVRGMMMCNIFSLCSSGLLTASFSWFGKMFGNVYNIYNLAELFIPLPCPDN